MSSPSRTERVELGIANVRGKLAALGLDRFVGPAEASHVGNYHFRCTNLEGLVEQLTHMDWTVPAGRDGYWQVREPVARLSLHIKHFDGWPADRLQAHIDPWGMHGLYARLRHALNSKGYQKVEQIARMLDAC